MKIASFGDSFIFGSDLNDCNYPTYSTKTWPALIAKNLNLQYECYAKPGCGNRYILNQILNNINPDYFYIIQWTWIDRYDYNTDNGWQTVRPSLDNKKIDQFYYINLHSELHDKQVSLGLIYQAISLLEEYNCKYLMTYMDPLMLDEKWHCPTNVKLLQQKINHKLSNINNMTFLDYARINNLPISKTWHPLEQAHTKASEYWMPQVCTLLNTNAKEDIIHASK